MFFWSFVFREEVFKEICFVFFKICIKVFVIIEGIRGKFFGVNWFFWGFICSYVFVNESYGFVIINEVWMGGVDVICLYGNYVIDKFIGWLYVVFEEVDDN